MLNYSRIWDVIFLKGEKYKEKLINGKKADFRGPLSIFSRQSL